MDGDFQQPLLIKDLDERENKYAQAETCSTYPKRQLK